MLKSLMEFLGGRTFRPHLDQPATRPLVLLSTSSIEINLTLCQYFSKLCYTSTPLQKNQFLTS